MRSLFLSALLAVGPAILAAQTGALSRADSALLGRILLAEDRRDTADASLAQGATHREPRIQRLARRAVDRITDSTVGWRDSFAPLPAPTVWPEPAWRLRFRALAAQRDDCTMLNSALADSAWPVRLHAADLARASCAGDASMCESATKSPRRPW